MENIIGKINRLKERRKRELCDKLGLYDEKRIYSEENFRSDEDQLYDYAKSKYYKSEKIYPSMSDEEFVLLKKYNETNDGAIIKEDVRKIKGMMIFFTILAVGSIVSSMLWLLVVVLSNL